MNLNRRSIVFSLHFNDTPMQPELDCLSAHAEPVEQLELLFNGVKNHTYFRHDGSFTSEYLGDAAPLTVTLRTCGTVRLESSVELHAGTDTCYLEAREENLFRLTLTETCPPPADIEVNEYFTTYAVAEEIVRELLEWPDDLSEGNSIYISFRETALEMTAEPMWLDDDFDYSFQTTYAELALDRQDAKNFTRLNVKNRSHLQRYVYGYLRSHPELRHLRFAWESTYLQVKQAEPPVVTLLQLCNDVYFGRIAALFDDMCVRYAKLICNPKGFTIDCYDDYHPQAAPMEGRTVQYVMPYRDMELFDRNPVTFHKALAQALAENPPAELRTNIQTEDCGSYILISQIEDPYFTFD